MIHHHELLQAIIANPCDDDLRLIYADWLEEHDESHYARFIRYQVEACQQQCLRTSDPCHHLYYLKFSKRCLNCQWWHTLEEKAMVLLKFNDGFPCLNLVGVCDGISIRRGFVEKVRSSWIHFITWGGEWLTQHPIEEVELLQRPYPGDDAYGGGILLPKAIISSKPRQ